MRFFVALLLILATGANAQVASLTTYIGNRIPNNTSGQISPTGLREAVTSIVNNFSSIPYSGLINTDNSITTTSYVSASTYYGDGSNLSGIAAGTVSGTRVIDVRNSPYNVICDGLPHSGNITGAQAALDTARTASGTTVYLAPPGVTCVYGTDTTVDLENPLKYTSNTDIVFAGKAMHNINNGDNFLLEGLNNALSCTSFQENVRILGLPGNMIDTVSRTTSQSRKFIGDTCTKNSYVSGINVSATTSNSGFACQVRNPENFIWENTKCAVFPEFPAASGGDAFHIHGNVSGTAIVRNNTFIGDDDACSQTLEGTSMNRMTQKGVVWDGNYCSTYRNSALKMGIELSTVSATIFGTRWVNNYFTVHGPYGAGSDGNCFKIDLLSSATRGQISDTLLANNVFDCPNGEAFGSQTTGAGPYGSIAGTTQQPQGLMNTVFRGNVFSGYQYRGVETGVGADGITFDGNIFTNYAGQRVIISPSLITSMTYSSANVLRIDFTPGTVFISSSALISPSAQYYVSVTAVPAGTSVSNTGRFYITQISDSFVLATATNVSSSSDVTNTIVSGSIIFRPGTVFYHRGARNVTIRNNKANDPPQFTNLSTESGVIPLNPIYENNQVTNFGDLVAYQDTASLNARFFNNQCIGATGDKCITESSSASISNSTFIMNRDSGETSSTRGGFSFADTNFREKWGNYWSGGSVASSTVISCNTGGLSIGASCP